MKTTKRFNKISLFDYNTLEVNLNRQYRSVEIFLREEHFTTETIFELESMFSWLGSHIEVNAVYLSTRNEYFSKGLDLTEMAKLSDEKWQRNLLKLQHLVYSMFFLPQTFIVDLKNGAFGAGVEFALGADIRIAKNNVELQLNHLKNGTVPHCGAVGFITPLFGSNWARQWLLTGKTILADELKTAGFLTYSYDQDDLVNNLLQNVKDQSPVARVQAKRSLLEAIMPELDRALAFEKKFALSGMSTADWKKIANGDTENLTPARDFSLKLKEEKQQSAPN